MPLCDQRIIFFIARTRAGVDFKIKLLTVGGKRLKLTIWDTGNCTALQFRSTIMLCTNFSSWLFVQFEVRSFAYSLQMVFGIIDKMAK